MAAEIGLLEAQYFRAICQASGASLGARDLDSLVGEVLGPAVRPGVASAAAFLLEGNAGACAWVKSPGIAPPSLETFAGQDVADLRRLVPGAPRVVDGPRMRHLLRVPGDVPLRGLALTRRERQGASSSLVLFFPERNAAGELERPLIQTLSDLIEMGRERIRLLARVERIATRDDVTTAFNFRFLKTALKKELSRASRRHEPLSVIMLDVDRLKEYNDRFGHSVGSRLLQQLAHVLASGVRDSDWVAKYGGDEFLILLPLTDKAGAIGVGERLRSMVREHVFERAQAGEVTASFGVASFPEDGDRSRTLIQSADQALYRAKHGGRDRLCAAGA